MHNTDISRQAAGLIIFALTVTLLVQSAAAKDFVIQNQTGTQIFAANGTTGNVGIGTLKPTTQLEVAGVTTLGGDLDLSGNAILNHYDISPCSGSQAIQDIGDDGSFSCVSLSSGDAGVDYDALVNRSGGSASSMTGHLNVGGNRIQNLGSADSTDDAMPRGDILSEFVEEGGDTMSGNLDMQGNDVQNVDEIGNGTAGLRFEQTGAVQVPNGRLRIESGIEDISQSYVDFHDGIRMNGNLLETEGGDIDLAGGSVTTVDSISADTADNAVNMSTIGMSGSDINNVGRLTGYYGGACGAGQAVADVNDDGTFTCVDVAGTVADVYVNESGDTMSGILNMGGNRIEGLAAADSGDDAMRRDNIQSEFVQKAGDFMTGNLDMRGNDLQNVDEIGNGSNTMRLTSTVDLQGNSLTGFFGSACPSGQAMVDVNNDGTYTCRDVAGEVADVYVNETGDTMTGNLSMSSQFVTDLSDPRGPQDAATKQYVDDQVVSASSDDQSLEEVLVRGNTANMTINMDYNDLTNVGSGGINISSGDGDINMNNNRVEGLQSADSTDDAMPRGDILSQFVESAGDTMSGNLDMQGNELLGVDAIGNGTRRTIQFNPGGDVEIPNGQLVVGIPGGDRVDIFRRASNEMVVQADASGLYLDSVVNGISFQNSGSTDMHLTGNGNLDMTGTNSLINVDSIGNGTSSVAFTSSIAMQGNAIQNPGSISSYYGSACPDGRAVADVNNDGTFQCVDVAGEVSDIYVNETGDTMSGILNMGGNQVENLGSADSTDDAMPRGDILSEFVEEAGDTMSGNLDMNGNELRNVDRIGNGSNAVGVTSNVRMNGNNIATDGGYVSGDGQNEGVYVDNAGQVGVNTNNPAVGLHVNGDLRVTDDLQVMGNITNVNVQNLNINGSLLPPDEFTNTFDLGSSARQWRDAYLANNLYVDGEVRTDVIQDRGAGTSVRFDSDLDMNGNSITSYFGSACGSGSAIQDVGDDGSFSCVSLSGGDAGVDYDALVNRSGGSANSMTGHLNVGGNRIQNLASADSTDDAMPRGDIVDEFVDEAGDSMTGNLDMQGNDLQNVNQIGNGSRPVAATSSVDMSNNRITGIGSGNTNFQSDGDLDMNGNSITSTGGEVCIGDQCA